MADSPEKRKDPRGFWDGGSRTHRSNDQSSGRASGFPGVRSSKRKGVATDLEFPPPPEGESKPKK